MRFLNRDAATALLPVASVAAITVGAAVLHDAAGWIVGGASGLYISWRLSVTGGRS